MPSFLTEQKQIKRWSDLEALARTASASAVCSAKRDRHHIRAERYADRAWSLAETNDHPFVASTLWG